MNFESDFNSDNSLTVKRNLRISLRNDDCHGRSSRCHQNIMLRYFSMLNRLLLTENVAKRRFSGQALVRREGSRVHSVREKRRPNNRSKRGQSRPKHRRGQPSQVQGRETQNQVRKNMLSEKRTPLIRSEIVEIKTKALRRGVWFRVLTRVERACIDLAIKVVERVRSRLLQKVLSSIIKKLEEALESQVQRLMREIGDSLAKKMSQIAQDWGNKSAVRWAKDADFMKYLTIIYMNAPP